MCGSSPSYGEIDYDELKKLVIEWINSGKMVEGAKYWAIKFFNITDIDILDETKDSLAKNILNGGI